jgi:hypothetical protein
MSGKLAGYSTSSGVAGNSCLPIVAPFGCGRISKTKTLQAAMACTTPEAGRTSPRGAAIGLNSFFRASSAIQLVTRPATKEVADAVESDGVWPPRVRRCGPGQVHDERASMIERLEKNVVLKNAAPNRTKSLAQHREHRDRRIVNAQIGSS